MLRIGFIGTGSFAVAHAEVLTKLGFTISACYGTNVDKTRAFSEKFNCKIYDDPLTLISKQLLDALYIIVPPFAHDGTVELKAVAEGVPFFCEKPAGLNVSICEEVARQVKWSKLITSAGYLLRYEPLFDRVKEIVDRNLVSTVRVCSYSYMPEVEWWRKIKLSGGMMVESGSHYIDLLRYLLGEISQVSAVVAEGIASHQISNFDHYDSMEALLKFETGIIGSMGVTHLLNKINARSDLLEIYGCNFALKVDLYKLRYKGEATLIYKESNDPEWKNITYPTSKEYLLIQESKAFLSAVECRDSSLIRSDYFDAVRSLKAALAMSASAGSAVSL